MTDGEVEVLQRNTGGSDTGNRSHTETWDT